MPTDEGQDARLTLTIETKGIAGATSRTNEEEFIEVKNNSKNVMSFNEQDQFGKTKKSQHRQTKRNQYSSIRS